MDRNELVFWCKRWRAARTLCRASRYLYPGVPDIAMLNYTSYLTEVFSYLYEIKEASCLKRKNWPRN